ncbi:MAG: hypothetical protein ACKPH1_18920, partial [Microcystis panniformis]
GLFTSSNLAEDETGQFLSDPNKICQSSPQGAGERSIHKSNPKPVILLMLPVSDRLQLFLKFPFLRFFLIITSGLP